MALDLEGHCETVADVDKARIFFSRADQEPSTAARQFLQFGNGVLVAAMFAPHYAVHAEFGLVGMPLQNLNDPGVLFLVEAVFLREVKKIFVRF